MNDFFNENIDLVAYKLELVKNSNGYEHIEWVEKGGRASMGAFRV